MKFFVGVIIAVLGVSLIYKILPFLVHNINGSAGQGVAATSGDLWVVFILLMHGLAIATIPILMAGIVFAYGKGMLKSKPSDGERKASVIVASVLLVGALMAGVYVAVSPQIECNRIGGSLFAKPDSTGLGVRKYQPLLWCRLPDGEDVRARTNFFGKLVQ